MARYCVKRSSRGLAWMVCDGRSGLPVVERPDQEVRTRTLYRAMKLAWSMNAGRQPALCPRSISTAEADEVLDQQMRERIRQALRMGER